MLVCFLVSRASGDQVISITQAPNCAARTASAAHGKSELPPGTRVASRLRHTFRANKRNLAWPLCILPGEAHAHLGSSKLTITTFKLKIRLSPGISSGRDRALVLALVQMHERNRNPDLSNEKLTRDAPESAAFVGGGGPCSKTSSTKCASSFATPYVPPVPWDVVRFHSQTRLPTNQASKHTCPIDKLSNFLAMTCCMEG